MIGKKKYTCKITVSAKQNTSNEGSQPAPIAGSEAPPTPEGGNTPVPTSGSEVTPTPGIGTTPVPTAGSEALPTPEGGNTPVPTSGSEATPTPVAGNTPVPTTEVTPAPSTKDTPAPTITPSPKVITYDGTNIEEIRNATEPVAVTIEEGITSIENDAFSNCKKLFSITIPNSVTSIGRSAFWECSGLARVQVAENNPVYDSRKDCNAIIETATNTLLYGCISTDIPSGVTSIGEDAFYECSGLSNINIPDSVASIGAVSYTHLRAHETSV